MNTLMVVSGGDAPGINAVLARYTALAAAQGEQVIGAMDGFAGALSGQWTPLAPASIEPLASLAGSYLRSSREPVLRQPDARERLRRQMDEHALAGIVLFGGDGTLRHIPPLLQAWGIPCIGIPTTIDNDIPGTEQTLGHDSACNFAYQSVDGALATAHALPERLFVIETLGGHTGFLALAVAFGAGAHAVLVPEFPYDDGWLAARLRNAIRRDGYGLLVLSEGVATARTLADTLPEQTGYRVRDTRLGHAQRGARVSHRDRTLAAHMARLAFQGLHDGVMSGVVVVREGRPTLHEGLLTGFPPRLPDRDLYDFVNGL